MPKTIQYFRDFSKGIITNIDVNDLPEQALYWDSTDKSKNFVINKYGEITGIKEPTEIKDSSGNSFNYTITSHGILNRRDGSKALIFGAGSGINKAENFDETGYDTPVNISSKDFNGDASALANTLHLGSDYNEEPIFVGEVPTYNFSGKADVDIPSGADNPPDPLIVDTSETNNTTSETLYIKITRVLTGDIDCSFDYYDDGTHIGARITSTNHGLSVGDTIVIENSSYEYTPQGETRPEVGTIDCTSCTVTVVVDANNFVVDADIEPGVDTATTHADWHKTPSGRPTFAYSQDKSTWSDDIDIHRGKEYYLGVSNGVNGYNLKVSFDGYKGLVLDTQWTVELYPRDSFYITAEEAKLNDYYQENGEHNVEISGSFSGSGTNFTPDKRYYYGYSFIYDDLQYSPIRWDISMSYTPSKDTDQFVGIITIPDNYLSISKRITGVVIFRASSSSEDYEPSTYFRVVKYLYFHKGQWRYDAIKASETFTHKFIDSGNLGSSFEGLTSIPESEKDILPKYKYSTVLNDRLFVANFTHNYFLNEGKFMIARSAINAYEMFDMTSNILKLPEEITAIKSFNNKIYAFTENNIYIINYELYVEDVLHNYGVTSNKNVIAIEDAMFIANSKGLYMITRSGIDEISFSIKPSWGNPQLLAFNREYNLVMAFYNTTVWAYDVRFKAWTYFDLSSYYAAGITYAFQFLSYTFVNGGRVAGSTPLYYTLETLFSGSQIDAEIIKPFNAGNFEEVKKWYNVYFKPTVTAYYKPGSIYMWNSINNGDKILDASGNWSRTTEMWFKLVGTSIKSLAVKFRRLVGVRND